MIPSLERLVDNKISEASYDLHGKEALNRFHFVFGKFCRAICTIAPLTLFFDDLQWGDAASMDLLLTLLQSRESNVCKSSLLVIGTFREEEVDDKSENQGSDFADSVQLPRLESLAISGLLNLTNITLQNLDEASTNELVARYLELSTDTTYHLGKILHDHSQGNPLHSKLLLQRLVNQGHIHRDLEHQQHQWTWDDQILVRTIGSSKTMDELVRQKLASLPHFTQKVLQHAACMGDEIDIPALATVLDGTSLSEIDLSVQAAASAGHLVVDQTGHYKFVHDRIRQAVSSMIDDVNSMSFQIGYILWTLSSPLFLSSKLFLVTNLLNNGIDTIFEQEERYKAAALNLEAGIKAASLAAFPDASRYSRIGIEFLEGGDYWKERYELTLSLFNNAIDAEVCNQDFNRVTELALIVFDNARSIKDTLTAHVARINSLGQLGRVKEALNTGLEVIHQLGEKIPEHRLAVLKTNITLRWSSNETMLKLPPMENEEKIAAMRILTILSPYAFFAGSKFTRMFGTKLARFCLLYGIHKCSALGFLACGWALCGKDSNEGYRLGKLALAIVDKYRARELIPHVHLFFYSMIYHWKRPLRESVDFLANAEKLAMELGDFEHAIAALRAKCNHGFWSGMNLSQFEELLVEALEQMKRYKQLNAFHITTPYLQYIHNLTGRAPDPKVLSGEAVSQFNPSKSIQNMSIPNIHYIFGMDLAYLFGDYELAQEIMEKRHKLNFDPHGGCPFIAYHFKEALIYVAGARCNVTKNKRWMKMARRNLKQMKQWAVDCPENFLHKQHLMEAEMLSLKNTPNRSVNSRIRAIYDKSIDGALQEGYIQEAALACELCGDYVLRQGERNLAEKYWHKACKLYGEWGATEKVAHLSVRMMPQMTNVERRLDSQP